jgi:hypothetical protein
LETEKAELEKVKVANENELKDKCLKELEAIKIDNGKKAYASKFVPKSGLGYKAVNSKKGVACAYEKKKKKNLKSHGNPPYHDPKIEALYHKSGKIFKKGIDLEKRKTYVPYRPARSKYVGLPSQRLCWRCGNLGHLHYTCPQREQGWRQVPSNVQAPVQVPNNAVRTRPKKTSWVWVPKQH